MDQSVTFGNGSIANLQTYYKAYDPKCFLLHERQVQKCISVNGHYFDNE